MPSLSDIFNFFGGKTQVVKQTYEKDTFQSAIKKYVSFYKKNPDNKVCVKGSVVWAVSNGVLSCVLFKKVDDVITYDTFFEIDFPPYRSCPEAFLFEANVGVNLEWRNSVLNYNEIMRRKLQKGQTYYVVGNSNYDHIVVESISNTNVKGKYGNHNVTVSKLQIGEPRLLGSNKERADLQKLEDTAKSFTDFLNDNFILTTPKENNDASQGKQQDFQGLV